jgi:hypothetical protein
LNHPEAIALITTVLLEKIRDGKHTTAELRAIGKTILGYRETLDGVDSLWMDWFINLFLVCSLSGCYFVPLSYFLICVSDCQALQR